MQLDGSSLQNIQAAVNVGLQQLMLDCSLLLFKVESYTAGKCFALKTIGKVRFIIMVQKD